MDKQMDETRSRFRTNLQKLRKECDKENSGKNGVPGREQALTRSLQQGLDDGLLPIRPIVPGSDDMCSPCKHGGNLVEAHGYCKDCNEHLCEACYNSHLLPKLFRKHVLKDKISMPRETPPSDDMCAKHPDQQLVYYCGNHDKLECSTCVNINHRTCEDVSYIQDICDGIEETKEFKTLYRALTSIENGVVQNKTQATTNLARIQTNVNEIKANIKGYREYLNQQLDRMEEAMYEDVNVIGASNKKTIEHISEECSTLTSKVRSVIRNFDTSRTTQQKMHMFITMKNTQWILTGCQNQLHTIMSKNKLPHYTFEPETQLSIHVEHGQNLGRLAMADDTIQPPNINEAGDANAYVQDQATGKGSNVKRPNQVLSKGAGISNACEQTMTATRDIRMNVRIRPDGKNCWITGSALVGNNRLAVTDYRNKALKLIDLDKTKVTYRLSLTDGLWDITQVNDHSLAATCPSGRYIQLVKLSRIFGTLTLDQQIQVHGECQGIRYIDTSGGRLVISFTHNNTVKVMDMFGTVLKVILFGSADLNFKVFGSANQRSCKTPLHISTSNDKKILIVSCEGDNTILGITLDGIGKILYRCNTPRSPRGVAVGDGGEIYVCGVQPHGIYVISSKDAKAKVLLGKKDGVNLPESIIYSDRKLFVGGDNNHIDVYRIQHL